MDDAPRSVFPGAAEVAEIFMAAFEQHWAGPVTPRPAPTPRPASAHHVDSLTAPLRVHGDEQVSDAQLERALAALEGVAARLTREGWPAPLLDGGRGGSGAFDLYLSPTDALATAGSDGPAFSHLDADVSFAIVDPGLSGEALELAVASAYAEALALNLDPAEAPTWRAATGAWAAWHLMGRFGCADALERQQQAPHLPWVSDEHGAGGGLFLAMVSQRHDGGSGAFVRDLWQLARQRTWEGMDLRASPDLWEALAKTTDLAGLRLQDLMADLSVARFLLGPERDAQAVFPALRGLGPLASPPVAFRASARDMPVHTRPSAELAPLGSGYALVDVREAPAATRLRVWLRGEYGVEWALVAVRFDANGREIGRLAAPPRRGDHRSYLPVELDAETTDVLVAVTNLSHRLPDADDPDPNGRAFRLIFDLVEEGRSERE
ncbi:MAG: hypothetical protein KF901_26610 [Myxococcales bacterium]|nr:hypothetical protein [Myxococcales bacterium]